MSNYKDILNDLKELKKKELSLDSFVEAIGILRKAYNIYVNDLKYGINSIDLYNDIFGKINEIMFFKIKGKFSLNNKVVFKMLDIVHHINQIPIDITLFNDNVIIVYQNINNLELLPSSYLVPSDNFCDISSNDFFGSREILNIYDKTVKNKALAILLKVINDCISSFSNEMAVYIEKGHVIYNNPDFNVYINRDLCDICKMVKNNSTDKITLLCKHDLDELNVFEIEVNKDIYSVSDLTSPAWKLSDNLKKSENYLLKKHK